MLFVYSYVGSIKFRININNFLIFSSKNKMQDEIENTYDANYFEIWLTR